MNYRIEKVPDCLEPEVIIRCGALDESVQSLIDFLEDSSRKLLGFAAGTLHILAPEKIIYIESFDNKVLIHYDGECYTSLKRLYELTEELREHGFLRISKSTILNIRKIVSVRPLFDGRLEARLKNGEKVAISRKYVSLLKESLGL